MGLDTSVPKSSTCASNAEDSVRTYSSFNTPAYRLRRLSSCWGRMLAKIDDLCAERDRLKKEEGSPTKGRVLGGRSW